MSPRQAEQHRPGVSTVFGRHPWATALLTTLATVVVVTLIVTGLVLHGTVGTSERRRGPARVSAATIRDQSRLTAALQQALGDRGWRRPQIALWICGGTGDEAAGWLRHIEVLADRQRTSVTEGMPAVRSILLRDGYQLLDPDDTVDTAIVNGVRGPGVDGGTVEIQNSPRSASIELTGTCES